MVPLLRDLASRSKSQDLYVLAVCGVADMHAKSGDPELALSVLRQLSLLSLSAAAHCYILVYKACAHTRTRQLDLALRALDRAAVFAEQTKNEAPSSWLGISDSSFVERYRASILAEFGASEALALVERLDQSTPTVFQRYRVTLATDRASTHAYKKQVEPAAESLASAVVLNQQTYSVAKAQRILKVRALLDPYRDSQAVKAVDEVIRETKARELNPGRSATEAHRPGPTTR